MSKNIMFLSMAVVTLIVFNSAISLAAGKKPIEITADQTLEWLQNKKQYIANGNVVVEQGAMKVQADRIVADYRAKGDNAEKGTDIWQLTATGNVILSDQGRILKGESAVYNLDTGFMEIEGENLSLKTDDMQITASEKMTYDSAKNVAQAIGDAHVKREKDDLTAKIITAYLKKDEEGKLALKSAQAQHNVKIVTPDEILKGHKGVYDLENQKADIQGNVEIIRGPNSLKGERATLNLKTSVSKMYASKNSKKRVKAVFYPGSGDNPLN